MSSKYNTTQLYVDRAEERGIIHRDYLAHCLRWTHVVKFAKMGQKILDVGCGINTPLAWTMYTNKYKPERYVGVDFRDKFETDPKKFNFHVELVGNFDVTKDYCWDKILSQHHGFDIMTCLEVIEHMEKADGESLLGNMALAAGPRTVVFLSTPVFNGSAAANHIHEWGFSELKEAVDRYFTVEAVHGTFASQSDIVPHLTPAEREVFESLKKYYDSNVLAILMAPNHPEHSRNCIWRLRVK